MAGLLRKIAPMMSLVWLLFLYYQQGSNFSNEQAFSGDDGDSKSRSSNMVFRGSTVATKRRRSPPMPELSPCQHWDTLDNETWQWSNTPCVKVDPTISSRAIAVSRQKPERRSFQHITKNETSVVFYGSSHVRELLEENVTRVASGELVNRAVCDPYKEGWGNLEGINMERCGKPGKRLVPELANRVAIGFHTFLHTPDADQIFLDWLKTVSLRQPDILVIDVGIWGPRGFRVGGSASTVWTIQRELDYYASWIQSSFPTSILVFVMDPSTTGGLFYSQVESRIRDVVASSSGRAVMLRKDLIMKSLPEDMPCAHGCAGPVLVVLANLFLDWLEHSLTNSDGGA
jgi:hypothetical protein